jgi:hypothetical protein
LFEEPVSPLKMVVGLSVSVLRDTAVTVRFALSVTVPFVAVIVVAVCSVMLPAAIEKVALVAPAGMVTFSGTEATAVAELDRLTRKPPAGAGVAMFTRFVVVVDPAGVAVGTKVIELRTGGLMVIGAVRVIPLNVAEIFTTVLAVTGCEVIVKFATLAPAATVTVSGTPATDELELDRLTTAPPAGAGSSRVTVLLVPLAPPAKEVGESVNLSTFVRVMVMLADRAGSATLVAVIVTVMGAAIEEGGVYKPPDKEIVPITGERVHRTAWLVIPVIVAVNC